MENIRKAQTKDLSRLSEIIVFNNRLYFYPIFKDEEFSFSKVTVLHWVQTFLEKDAELLRRTYVYDDGIVRGLVVIAGNEVEKLYVEPAFQSMGVGGKLLGFAVKEKGANFLWALEKNYRGIEFYRRHGFVPNGEKEFEEGTDEYLVKLVKNE